jgi:hypothetical protein
MRAGSGMSFQKDRLRAVHESYVFTAFAMQASYSVAARW